MESSQRRKTVQEKDRKWTSRREVPLGAWGEQMEGAQLRSREWTNKGQVAPSHGVWPLLDGQWEPQKPRGHSRTPSDSLGDEEEEDDGRNFTKVEHQPRKNTYM